MIKNENYVNVQGWMINELNLKGNSLIIYAIIFGFSQSENQFYTGGLQYLSDWTNSSKQSTINVLKKLVECNIIEKKEKFVNGVKFCEYKSTKFNTGSQQSLPISSQQSLHNNKTNNKTNNIKDIVEYLNQKANKQFKSTTSKTKTLISARLKDGFNTEDFKTVIDIKCKDWLNDDKMNEYLRPETLFGTKFESYLNSNNKSKQNEQTNNDQEITKEVYDRVEKVNEYGEKYYVYERIK